MRRNTGADCYSRDIEVTWRSWNSTRTSYAAGECSSGRVDLLLREECLFYGGLAWVLGDSSQFARPHSILECAALSSAGKTVPLLRVLDADAAKVAMLVSQQSIARRTHESSRGNRRAGGHQPEVGLARRDTSCRMTRGRPL